MGVWACRRAGVVLVGGGRWFLGAQRSGGEQLAANLLICYLIQRLPASGVRKLKTSVGVYHQPPPFSETMNICDVYMSKRRCVAPVLEWDRLRLAVWVPYERAW